MPAHSSAAPFSPLPQRTHCFVNLPCAFTHASTHARTGAQTNNPSVSEEKNKHVSTQTPVLITICTFLYTAAACNTWCSKRSLQNRGRAWRGLKGRGRDASRAVTASAGEDSEIPRPVVSVTDKRAPFIHVDCGCLTKLPRPVPSPARTEATALCRLPWLLLLCFTPDRSGVEQSWPRLPLSSHLALRGQTSLGVRARWATLAGTQPQHTSHSAFWISWFLKA